MHECRLSMSYIYDISFVNVNNIVTKTIYGIPNSNPVDICYGGV